jgi:hypothetical protein
MTMLGRALALIVVALVGVVVSSVSAQSPNITVSVTGSGPSIDEAKTDAIRQALQITMRQLVVVDRAIHGNTILRDKVMSTMNGYIESINIRNIQQGANAVSVKADITVSSSRIENFIGIPSGPRGEVEGGSMFVEVNRRLAQNKAEELQARARGEIFDRVLRGYPTADIEVKVLSIGLENGSADWMNVQLILVHKPTFIKTLMGTIAAFSKFECLPYPRIGYGSRGISLSGRAYGSLDDGLCLRPESLTLGYTPPPPRPSMCAGFTDTIKCFRVEAGRYCASCIPNELSRGKDRSVLLFGKFLDSNGRSTLLSQKCLMFKTNVIDEAAVQSERGATLAFFDFLEHRVALRIATHDVDLARTKRFVALAAFMGQNGQGIMSYVPDPMYDGKDGCEILDEALSRPGTF